MNRDSGSVKPSQSNGEAGRRIPSGGKGKRGRMSKRKIIRKKFYAYFVNLFKSTKASKRQQ